MKTWYPVALAALSLLGVELMAQTNSSTAVRWLENANVAPPFQAPGTLRAWEKKRAGIRTELTQLLGELPPRPKPSAVKTISRETRDGYVLEKFQFDNGAGSLVNGYLLLPTEAKGKVPGILYCHWHGGQYDIGKEELFKTNAVPVPAGPALARKGFAVLAIDACCFGERNGQGPGGPAEKGSAGEMTASKFNLWVGRTLWGMIVRDDLIALDYLCSRPEVDRERIGVTGISMGATRTWWVMAMDERPKAAVAVGCLTRYQDLITTEGLKYHGIYYFVPDMLKHFDTEAVVALSAPRPILFMTGEEDYGSPREGIAKIQQRVVPVYRLYGRPEAFQNVLYPGVGHVYLPEMWQKTLGWMQTHLTEKTR